MPTDKISFVALRSGLSINTCREMLSTGWVFIEEHEKASRWELQFGG